MTKSIKLLRLYLQKVTKLNENERKMVFSWINDLFHPKIVLAPDKSMVEMLKEQAEKNDQRDTKFINAQLFGKKEKQIKYRIVKLLADGCPGRYVLIPIEGGKDIKLDKLEMVNAIYSLIK